MRIKNLLFLLMAMPLAFAACETPDQPVDEVKNPTVAITVGETTESSIAFTITSTDADEVKYLVVESAEGTPTATEVLSNGTAAEVNAEAGCYVAELKAETEYTIVAAAKNAKAVVKAEAKMTTKKGGEEPVPPTPGDEYDVTFAANEAHIEYYGDQFSPGYNYYVILSDVGVELTENEMSFKETGIYYLLDLYAADSAENNDYTVPNGKYKAATSSAAGTFGLGDYGAGLNIVEGVPTYYIYADGEVVVSDGKIEAIITMEDGAKHKITFEGSLYFGDNGEEPVPPTPGDEFSATHTATKWLWGGASSYGNKYQVIGDNFSVDVHFPAQFAQESSLTAGDYIWTSTTWFGYNDFDNEFTTRSLSVDGTSVAVDGGSAKVEANGDEYHIELTLEGRDGFKYMIEYNGKLNDNGSVGGGETTGNVAFSKIEYVTYNSSYYYYEYKLTNAAGDKMSLYVNDYQANEAVIYSDDTYEWITRSYAGNLGFFSTANIVVGGVSYEAVSGGMVVVTDDATYAMDITINLTMASGAEITFTVNGKMNEENGGGTTPSEPTKLATPSVSGVVSGNAATISWQEVAGAKDYTVTLNGSLVSTVAETYIVYSDLEYGVTYSVSVVANPADSAANSASDAGTATFTTEADPNAGGNEGGNDSGASFENWVFDASLNMGAGVITVTDGSHTVEFTLNQVSGGTFYIYDNGVLNITKVVVNGVETSDASGTVEMSSNSSYYIVLDCTINGVKYTGTSNNPVV